MKKQLETYTIQFKHIQHEINLKNQELSKFNQEIQELVKKIADLQIDLITNNDKLRLIDKVSQQIRSERGEGVSF